MNMKVRQEVVAYICMYTKKKEHFYINLSVLQRIHSANYDLQTELEDFVALQAARERAENELID